MSVISYIKKNINEQTFGDWLIALLVPVIPSIMMSVIIVAMGSFAKNTGSVFTNLGAFLIITWMLSSVSIVCWFLLSLLKEGDYHYEKLSDKHDEFMFILLNAGRMLPFLFILTYLFCMLTNNRTTLDELPYFSFVSIVLSYAFSLIYHGVKDIKKHSLEHVQSQEKSDEMAANPAKENSLEEVFSNQALILPSLSFVEDFTQQITAINKDVSSLQKRVEELPYQNWHSLNKSLHHANQALIHFSSLRSSKQELYQTQILEILRFAEIEINHSWEIIDHLHEREIEKIHSILSDDNE